MLILVISICTLISTHAEVRKINIGESVNTSSDLLIIKERLIKDILQPEINETHISNLVNSIREDGSWPGINYEDFSHTGFEHSTHRNYILELSRAFKKPGSGYYNNPELLQVIYSAIDLWLEHDFIASNWHTNEIAGPATWVNILLIMDTDLTGPQRAGILRLAKRANLNAWGARPGGDLVKIAGIMALTAVYEEDEATLESALDAITKEIQITSGKGIKPDLSFHHRVDRVTSVLSYGTGYTNEFAEWAVRFKGTSFSFPDKSMELIVDYFLDGICQTMVYGKYPDPGSMNRGISRPGALRPRSADLAEKLFNVSSYRKEELKMIVNIRKGIEEPGLTGNRFFWHSEYHSHQRPHYFTSVRMYSDRNRNMEYPHNQESIKHHHYADGANFISVTGQEYYDIYPVFDWMKIPGTTIVQKPELPGAGTIVKRGMTDFVGGVTDGEYGAASFDFASPHDPLKARKAWFMFDREIVSLGNSIESGSQYPVATTINQSLLNGNVKYNADGRSQVLNQGEHVLENVDWIYHDRIAYLFPQSADINLNNTTATGNWYDINRQSHSSRESISREVFKLWVDHGTNPQGEKYEYIILPGVEADEIESYRENPGVEILANNTDIQAVKNKNLNLVQIVFYNPGSLDITNEVNVSSMLPGLVMVKTNEKKVEAITVADPTRQLGEMHIKINTRFNGSGSNWKAEWNRSGRYTDVFIGLPTGDLAGKSVNINTDGPAYKGTPYVVESLRGNGGGRHEPVKEDQKYFIGQEYGGGIIFYVDESGQRGLIAARNDQSAGVSWRSGQASVIHSYGSHLDRLTNASGDGIGAGYMNTIVVISQYTSDNPFNNFAARECAAFQEEGFGDWYLPSKHELDLMYNKREIIGNFEGESYWSSTEYNVGFTWGQSFYGYGSQDTYTKGTRNSVRCIRRF